ncbi:SCO5389 family protein [Catenulispora yoronensis]|uniref:SCO5389 family protein n=1 Tax=Catenulispora yoronensis TaxID=450799 RepID=A0ABP5H1J4_9ACTN
MSLDVSPELLAAAELGEVSDEQFADCVRTSLPYAWQMVSDLSTRLHVDGTGESGFVDNTVPPPDEQARGQLLRALASDSIRGCLERHFGVRLAFQNCHRVAVFPAGTPRDSDGYRTFTSVRAQLLNQSPLLRDC